MKQPRHDLAAAFCGGPKGPRFGCVQRCPRVFRPGATIGALIVLFVGAASAGAQEQGPIVFGQKKAYDPFWMGNFQGTAELLFQHQDDNTAPTTGAGQRIKQDLIQPTLELAADAYIIHPNFVDMKMSGTLGATQQWTDDSTNGATSHLDTVDQYDLSATFLRKEKAPLTLYSRRTETLTNQEFSGTLTNTQTTSGAMLNYRSETLPTQLNYYYMQQKQTDPTGAANYGLDEHVLEWHTQAKPDEGQLLTWDYNFNDVTQQNNAQAANDNFQIHDGTLTHSWDFGDSSKSNLTSSLNVFDQTGAFGLKRLRWDENLHLQHTKDFRTDYQTTVDTQERPNATQTLYRGRAGFQHMLYESLVTSGHAGLNLVEQSPGARTIDYLGDLSLDYRKKIPFGKLSAGYTLNLDFQEADAHASPTSVPDEPHTFVDPTPIILLHQNIDATSIVVTDTLRIRVFSRGVDYTVTAFPDRMEINRVIGGAIHNGDSVLISYQILPEPAHNTDTVGNSFFVRYDIDQGVLKGLAFYGRYFHQEQTVSGVSAASSASFIPNNIDDYLGGAEYRFWQITASAEHEVYRSTIAPYDASRFRVHYSDRLARKTEFGADLNYTILDYSQDHNHVAFTSVSAFIAHQLTKELSTNVTAAWRNETDQLHGESRGIETQVEINWRHRQTEVFSNLRAAFLDSSTTYDTHLFFQFGVRRHF